MSLLAVMGIAETLGITDWISEKINGSKGGKVAAKVLDIASQVTGVSSPQQIAEKLQQDKELAAKLRQTILDNEHELNMAAYADRKDARDMYKVHPQQANKIAHGIMRWNLPAILALLILNGVALHFFQENSTLLLAIGNVVGMAIKSLFDERTAVTGFYFGSSMHQSEEKQT